MKTPSPAVLGVLAALLLLPVAAASAAAPRDGRYAGPTTQQEEGGERERMGFTVARAGREIRGLRFASVARCAKGIELRVIPVVRRPVALVAGPRIKLRGTLDGTLHRGSTYRAVFWMDGRFPVRDAARGTWALRAVVRDRRGRVTARCKTGRVSWRALHSSR